ncbi:MAG: hypothetical protein II816_04035, partial [Elusimicrobia bacterium]|nr:hypothetical protein [Elusimicrobiota bacterium]
FKTDVSSVTVNSGKIENAGTLKLTSAVDENNNEITGLIIGENTVYGEIEIEENTGFINNAKIKQAGITIAGTLYNNEGKQISVQNSITIEEGASLQTSANDITGFDGSNATIQNAGVLEFEGYEATNKSRIQGITDNETTSYGELRVYHSLKNEASIIQQYITLWDGEFTTTEDITALSQLVILSTEFDNSGTGTSNAAKINAASIINYSEGLLKSNADNVVLTNNGTLQNIGTYDVLGGTISYAITGVTDYETLKGTVNINTSEVTISSAISGNIVNIGTSTALNDVQVKLKKEDLLTGADLVIKNGAIINTQNTSTGTISAQSITIDNGASWEYRLDVDLFNTLADNFNTSSWTVGEGSTANLDDVILLSDLQSGVTEANIAIANTNILADPTIPQDAIHLATPDKEYSIVVEYNSATGNTELKVVALGSGSLPKAIANQDDSYSLTKDELIEDWTADGGSDTLGANLIINGVNNNKLFGTNETGATVTGIKVGTYTLTINNLAGFEGFENALEVKKLSEDEVGALNLSTVTFKNNIGDSVIDNEGNATLSGVTFEENTATVDVNNKGAMLITATAGETSFENGVIGTGTTTVAGATVNFGGNAKFEQASISIEEGSQVTANAANVKVTGVNNILYNSGSLVLYSTATDTIDFA